MYPTQSNTHAGGAIAKVAGEDLTDLDGRLVKLDADGEVILPTAITDITPFLLVEDGASGDNVTVLPFTGEKNHRVRLNGTCNAGDTLVLADTAVAGDKGKLRALPAAPGTYRGIAIAEEDGVDEQLVLCRPYPVGNITVV